jgi:hypothetical protein
VGLIPIPRLGGIPLGRVMRKDYKHIQDKHRHLVYLEGRGNQILQIDQGILLVQNNQMALDFNVNTFQMVKMEDHLQLKTLIGKLIKWVLKDGIALI